MSLSPHERFTAEIPPMPERRYTTAELAHDLKLVPSAIVRMTNSPGFHKVCLDYEVDPFSDMDTPGYARLLADFGHEAAERGRETYGPGPRVDALEMLAAAPLFVYQKAALDSQTGVKTDVRPVEAVAECSEYSALLRQFSRAYPEVSADSLIYAMTEITRRVIDNPRVTGYAVKASSMITRGARAENALQQLLLHAGLPTKEATTREDLAGIDCHTITRNGTLLGLDAKASLEQIDTDPDSPKLPYRVKSVDGDEAVVAIWPLVTQNEFGDKMVLPPTVISAKANKFGVVIDMIETTVQEQRRALGHHVVQRSIEW